ncbi:Adaptor protein complex AP-3 delta subunit, partial [Obba rivulosa]
MWERTLQDLIRGLRANKKDESKFISQAIDEIRQEVRSKDMELKAGAVLKLTYLDMLGYDMGWASFHIVEVMSSPRIHLKSVGYLAASQSFQQNTDVLMLTTNLLKKDLSSKPEDVAVALNGLSHIVTPDLGRDLSQEITAMLNHSRAHIRKRAVLALFKVFIRYPEAIPQGMPRLREKLEDPDPGVVAATVNVLCELVYRSPQDYLSLAPQLFHLLTTSSNNWMLIKIIKLFGILTPHEPRLVRKLQPPITDLISTTPAVSLLYECVRTCITGGMLESTSGFSLARTCVTKLASFLQDPDQNLKYIALLAMVKIVPTHPQLVAEYQDMILASVDDQDISIRMRALDLVSAMVSRSNLQPIIQQLLSHLVRSDSALPSAAQSLLLHTSANSTGPKASTSPSQSPAYRLTLAQRILALGSQDMYDNVVDFEWYLSVLVDLAYVAGVDVGEQIRDQLLDIAVRVRGARRFAVQLMIKVLSDDIFLLNASDEGSCAEILWAAAWICGEFCGELAEPYKLLTYLLQPHIALLSPDIAAVYLQSAMKVFGTWAAELAARWDDDDLPKVKSMVELVLEQSTTFAANPNIEVQERAAEMQQLFTFIRADLNAHRPRPSAEFDYGAGSGFDESASSDPQFPKSLFLMQPLFRAYELNPVAPNAQACVPVPEGLDLDAWIVPPPKEAVSNGVEGQTATEVKKKHKKGKAKDKGKAKFEDVDGNGFAAPAPDHVETEEERVELERRKAARLERLRDDPYYLIDDRAKPKSDPHDVDSIPIVKLDDLPPPTQAGNPSLPRLRDSSSPMSPQAFVIDKTGEMPHSARASPSTAGEPPTLVIGSGAASPEPPSAFPVDTGTVEASLPATPQAIKVTRAKKKASS